MRGSVQRIFWETCRFPSGSPFVQFGVGLEEHFPWRHGQCVIVRIPGTGHGMAVGVWLGYQDQGEDEDGPYLVLRPMDITAGVLDGQEEQR